MQNLIILNHANMENEKIACIFERLHYHLHFIDSPKDLTEGRHKNYAHLLLCLSRKERDAATLSFLKQWLESEVFCPWLVLDETPSIERAIRFIKMGAKDCLSLPLAQEKWAHLVHQFAMSDHFLETQPLCCSPNMVALYQMAKKVAPLQASVFLSGESGTGKEILAQYIHQEAGFSGDFVALNCAAIPENMLEAQLFGFEKGAFTGAYTACPGKFEMAENGTLFLDEVTEIPQHLQAKLLRVLQEKKVERLGGKKSLDLKVRIIAASNRHLKTQLKEGHFREDLFYRLNVFPIDLPPLRARKAEIIPLTERFLQKYAIAFKAPIPKLSLAAKKYLQQKPWPGNVRELENHVQRALILQRGPKLDVQDFDHVSQLGAES